MANISCTERAQELLRSCLEGRDWPRPEFFELIDGCPEEFFRIVVERLADLFEPRLCDVYAGLFSEAIAHALPEFRAEDLVARYRRVRRVRRFTGRPRHVFVLSRVTLGADIKVTGLVLNAAKQRFPDATVYLAGGAKSAELFAGDARIHHAPVSYPRGGSLRERLAFSKDLQERLAVPGSIVIDPDSRLSQLGLLPVCAEENYLFFESRAYGGAGEDDLSALTRRWIAATLGVLEVSNAFDMPASARPTIGQMAVSLGVGDNPAKRIDDPFEAGLLALLAERPGQIVIDKGAGGDEAGRVDRALSQSGIPRDRVRFWEGSFAGFAAVIAQSDLYVGFDSAGQHAAAALGIPLLTIFSGYASERMFARWRPTGPGKIEVVKVENPDPRAVLARVRKALDSLVS